MNRENFHRLLQQYQEGRCTPEEAQLVEHWYQMLDFQHTGEITLDNLDAIEESIWDKIHEQINHDMAPAPTYRLPKSSRTKRIRIWMVAASVAVLLIASGTFFYYRVLCHPSKPTYVVSRTPEHDVINIKNTTQATMPIVLPDESLVELDPGAQLEYPKDFSSVREVKLIGDAFFSVEADPKHPFWVFHEGMITKVVGTKFKIKAPTSEADGEVIVYTGQVDVYYNGNTENIIRRIISAPKKNSLTANKRGVLRAETLEEAIIAAPEPIAKQAETLQHEVFENTPIPTLAKTLGTVYGLDVVADETLSGVTFTGNINGIGLFKQLDIICTVTNTAYEVAGTTITLKRKH